MRNIFNMDDWKLDENVPAKETFADVSITLVYPGYEQFLHLKPKQRIKKIDEYHRANLNRLLALKLFGDHTISGTKKRPTTIETRIKLSTLTKLEKLDFISLTINAIDGATRTKTVQAKADTFFCVRMTVAIEIENLKTKKQGFEQRFVLIKAISFNDAYEKIEANRNKYSEPYLNSDGRLVRWRIESLDDYYEVGEITADDLNTPEGIEVYSKLKTRKRKTFWDGKS